MSRSLYSLLHSQFRPVLSVDKRVSLLAAKLKAEQGRWQPPKLPPDCLAKVKSTEVAVVGGGFAGLYAARLLRQLGASVTLFEAGKEVGGRVRSDKKFGEGRVIEMGAELIGSFHLLWKQLALEFGLSWVGVSDAADHAKAGLMPRLVLDKLLDLRELKALIEEMELRVLLPIAREAEKIEDPSRPWEDKTPAQKLNKPLVEKWDRMSVADKLTQLGVKKTERLWTAMDMMLRNNNVAGLEDIGYLGLLCLVKGGQLSSDESELMSYWNDLELFRCGEGNQELARHLARQFETEYRGIIYRDTVVTQIDLAKGAVLEWNKGGKTNRARYDYVVLAIPPSVWGAVKITPRHPKDTIGLMGMGPAAKFFTGVSRRFWITERAAPVGGSLNLGQVWEGTDNQTQTGNQGTVLSVFTGTRIPSENDYVAGLSKLYKNYRGSATRFKLADWSKESFIKTGYASPKKGQVLTIGKELNEPYLGRMFFAGEHTQMDFFGYMEGALRSGARAAIALVNQACLPAQPNARAPRTPSPARTALAGAARVQERTAFEREMESLLGPIDREEIQSNPAKLTRVNDSFAVPFRFVCHLKIYYNKTRELGGGTGVLISPSHVLTVAHNLYTREKLTPRRVTVSPALNGKPNSIGGVDATRWDIHSNWLASGNKNSNFDWALLTLEKEVGRDTFEEIGHQTLGYWGDSQYGGRTMLVPLPPERVDGQVAYCAGYPGTTNPSNDVMYAGSGRVFGYQPKLPMGKDDLLMQHTVSTHKGQSGSPVWIREAGGALCLVGLHVMPGRQDANRKYTSNFAVRFTTKIRDLLHQWMGTRP